MSDDHDSIRHVRHAYGRALDTRDWALFASLFADEVDADFSAWGIPPGRLSPPDLVALMRPAFRRDEMRSQQVYANVTIDQQGDRASVTSSLVGFHHLPGLAGGTDFTLHATYHDRFVRTPAGWKIASVRLEVVFTTGNPAVLG